MTKKFISTRVDEKLLADFRAIAEKRRWSIQTTMEVCIEEFVKRERQANGNSKK